MNFSGQGYFITHLTQFMGFLQNGDEIVGNPGKSEKTIDNARDSGVTILRDNAIRYIAIRIVSGG